MALVLSSISGSIQSSSRVGLTGSIIIANRPDNLFPSIPSDATLFVSGSSSSDYAVFGGSVVGSGSLLLKNASGVTQFNAASTGLTVSDSSGNSKFSVAAASGNTTVGGTLTSTGVITANGGISGSHTKLADGTSYIIAGSNIVVTTGSNGAITIAGTMNASTLVAGTDTQIQFNDGGSAFGGDSGLTYNKTTDTLNGVTGSFFAVNTSGNASVGGALTVTGASTLNGSVTVGDASADTVTVNGTTTFAGSGVTTTFAGNSQVGGVLGVTGSAGFNGNVTLGDASADTVTVNGTTTFAGSGVTTTFAGDVAVNGGDVTSTATTFNLLNSTVTTLNLGGAATTVEIGAATGTTSVNNSLTVDGNTTLGNASSDTMTVNGFATFNNGLIGSLTSSNVTAGQVVLAGTGGVLSGSNGLFWHNASGSLGIGTTQPTGKFEVAGVSGSLFAVTDSMSGSLLSVNNVSGLPIFEVFSDNRLVAGGYNTNAFVVSGSRVAVGTTPINTTELLVSGSSTSSDKVLLVKAGVAGQTGALIDAQNSAGSSVFIVSNTGISGSLTKLTDGSSYLIAGNNVTITTGSTGAVTIAAAMNASALVGGSDTQLQFNDGGSFGGDSGLTYNKTTDTLTGVSGSFFSLSTSGNSSVGGALTVTGASTLNGNVTVGDASSDTVTVNGTTTFAGSGVTTTFAGDVAVNGGDMTSSAATFNLVNSGVTTLNLGGAATAVSIGAATGTTTVNNGLTVTGASTLNGNVTVGDASADTVTVNGTTTFAGAGVTTTFAGDVAVNGGDMTSSATTFNLLNSTVTTLNVGGAATAMSLGASSGTTTVKNSLTVSGSTILGDASSDTVTVNGAATFNQGLSGSLTKLADGSNYLIGGSNISIVTGSNGAITISTSADITSVTGGNGLTGGGSTGDLTLTVDDSKVAMISGSTFTGAVKFNAGLSGSLTKLTDGSSAFIAGNNVTITTGSNGAVTIAASMNASALVAGTDTQIQFNDGGAFGADSGLTYNKTTDTLNGVTGSFFSLSTSGNSSVGGALTVTGASTLNGNVTVGDAAADTVTVNGTTTFAGAAVTTTFAGNSQVGGNFGVTGSAGFNGSVTLGDASADTVTVNGTTTFAGSGVTTTFAGDVAVNGGDVTSSATTFNLLNATVTTLNIGGAATAVEIGAATGTTSVNNNLTVDGNTTLGNATTDTVTLTAAVASNVLPSADVTYNLGSSTLRWANIYTGDLHLKNERGDYTLIEEEDFLTIRFNKTGKRYKFMLEAVPELDEALGNFSSGPKG
jgi:hypothetical protein